MVLVLAASLLLQEKSGEEIYRTMMAKVDEAKTVRLTAQLQVDTRTDRRNSQWRSTLTLALSDKNRARLEVKTSSSEGDRTALYISDGSTTRAVWTFPDGAATESKETPGSLGSALRKSILGGDLETPLLTLFQGDRLILCKVPLSGPTARSFGGSRGRSWLQFETDLEPIRPKGEGRTSHSSVSLYYNPQSLAPIERYAHYERPPEPGRLCGTSPSQYLETWSTLTLEKFTLNEVMGEESFRLPPERK